MNIEIGAIIRKLRTENNVTQDVLATALGVTPQAISRWESDGGYPDIELLPALPISFRSAPMSFLDISSPNGKKNSQISKRNWLALRK